MLDFVLFGDIIMSCTPGGADFRHLLEKLNEADENCDQASNEHDPNRDRFLVRAGDVASHDVVAWFAIALIGLEVGLSGRQKV